MCRTGWMFYTPVTSHFTMIDCRCPFCTTGRREQRERVGVCLQNRHLPTRQNAVQRTRPDKAIVRGGPNRLCSHVEIENRKIYLVNKITDIQTQWYLLYLHWNTQNLLLVCVFSWAHFANNQSLRTGFSILKRRSKQSLLCVRIWIYFNFKRI